MKPVANQKDAGLNSKGKPRYVRKDGAPRKLRGKPRQPRIPGQRATRAQPPSSKRSARVRDWYGSSGQNVALTEPGKPGKPLAAMATGLREVRAEVQPLFLKALRDQAFARVALIEQLGKVLPEVVETVLGLMRGVNRVEINGVLTVTPVKADVRLAAARQLAEWARLGQEQDRGAGEPVDTMTIDQLDSLIEAGRAELLERAAQQRVIESEPVATDSIDPTRITDVM